MSDIYKTPKSELIDERNAVKTVHRFWKIFFWLNCLLAPLAVLMLFIYEEDELGKLEYIDIVIFIISIMGLRRFVYARNTSPALFWRCFTVVYFLWTVFYMVIAAYILKIPIYGELATLDWYILLDLFFLGPMAIALYLYSFGAKDTANSDKQL